MDDRTETFVLLLSCAVSGGALGAALGAVAGALSWSGGRAAGTGLALAVARAVTRVSRVKPTPTGRGALVGAVDGFLFLGLVALGVGFLLRRFGQVPMRVFGVIALAGLILTTAAVVLGLLAYALLRTGIHTLAWACTAAVIGATLGLRAGGWPGFLAGGLGGFALTTFGFLLVGSLRPGGTRSGAPDKEVDSDGNDWADSDRLPD
jgi:hypothetical protein